MNQKTILGDHWRRQRARCAALGRAGYPDSSPEMIKARAELHTLRFEQRLAELVADVDLTDDQRQRLVRIILGDEQ